MAGGTMICRVTGNSVSADLMQKVGACRNMQVEVSSATEQSIHRESSPDDVFSRG